MVRIATLGFWVTARLPASVTHETGRHPTERRLTFKVRATSMAGYLGYLIAVSGRHGQISITSTFRLCFQIGWRRVTIGRRRRRWGARRQFRIRRWSHLLSGGGWRILHHLILWRRCCGLFIFRPASLAAVGDWLDRSHATSNGMAKIAARIEIDLVFMVVTPLGRKEIGKRKPMQG